jgi:hypothetical protein
MNATSPAGVTIRNAACPNQVILFPCKFSIAIPPMFHCDLRKMQIANSVRGDLRPSFELQFGFMQASHRVSGKSVVEWAALFLGSF